MEFLESDEYRQRVRERLLEGSATSLEILAAHWHGGKPKETQEIKVESLDSLYATALEKGLVKGSERRSSEDGTAE